MSRTFLATLTFLTLTCFATADGPDFADGEGYRFRVSWGIFRTAGILDVNATHETIEGRTMIRVVTTTQTYGLIRAFYPFDGFSDCVFDSQTGRLLSAKATTSTPKRQTNTAAVLDYAAEVVRYEDRVDPSRTETLPIPKGFPMDMITTLLCARDLKLQPGETADVVVMFDKEFYELTIHAEGYEKVDTAQGEIEALVLTPKMEKNPRGMFRRGGQVRVWVSRDEAQLPVKLQVQLKYGTGTAYLTDFRAGNRSEGLRTAEVSQSR